MSYVFGYTNFIDGSARGLQPAGNTSNQMSRVTPSHPWDVHRHRRRGARSPQPPGPSLVNGELKQNFNTNDI